MNTAPMGALIHQLVDVPILAVEMGGAFWLLARVVASAHTDVPGGGRVRGGSTAVAAAAGARQASGNLPD